MRKITWDELSELTPDNETIMANDPVFGKYLSWAVLNRLDEEKMVLIGMLDHEGKATTMQPYQSEKQGYHEPEALGYYPYFGCDIYQCGDNGGYYFIYREMGGSAAVMLCRLIRRELLVLTPPEITAPILVNEEVVDLASGEIKKLGEVKNVKAYVEPGYNDDFREPTTFELTIPAIFPDGKKWDMIHTCCRCGTELVVGNEKGTKHRVAGATLHTRKLTDAAFLDKIAKVFDLVAVYNTDANNNITGHYYRPHHNSTGACHFTYYKCNICDRQYFRCADIIYGSERPDRPDQCHLVAVVEVQFDEAIFLEAYHKCYDKWWPLPKPLF